jgi:hypothetical protein
VGIGCEDAVVDRGEVIVRREVWRGRPWSAMPVVVIEDSDDVLALHLPVGAPFGFPADHPLGVHPWSRNGAWKGMDVVMLQRPGDAHSVWFFGPFSTYVHLQAPFLRTSIGIDTFDHDLDIVVAPDGTWTYKDEDHLVDSVASGRCTEDEADAIRAEGARIAAMLDAGTAWWSSVSSFWSSWTPPERWPVPSLRADWLDPA